MEIANNFNRLALSLLVSTRCTCCVTCNDNKNYTKYEIEWVWFLTTLLLMQPFRVQPYVQVN